MELLIIVQIIFYAVFSLAIIIFSVLALVLLYNFIRIEKHVRKISENLENASQDVKENLESLIGKIIALPLLSLFFKKMSAKGRHKSSNK
jgi:biopolymer transport protein ExbB/TolQ